MIQNRYIPRRSQRCPDCGLEKPLEEFPRNRNSRDGHATYCKPCHNTRTRESVRRNGGARRYHLRQRYGVEPRDVERMILEQDGKCLACGKPDPSQVDHDHETGRIRGILCLECNAALGAFRDDVNAMYNAIAYLEAGGVRAPLS